MTKAVLVHGNPETAAIWGPMIEQLDRTDVDTLSPPGFGAPVPDGFGATPDDYVAWLASALEAYDEPVDLVGHDWGGGHVMRIAIERPDLIRSWAMDIAGAFAPDYVWHDMAQVWATPGAGEEMVAGLTSMPLPDRGAMFESFGITAEVALTLASGVDDAMGRCILTLYRAAAQPYMSEFGARLGQAAGRPGLVIIATDDGYTGGEERARWAADQAGARVAMLPGLGHWWMVQDPKAGAAVLDEFWAGL